MDYVNAFLSPVASTRLPSPPAVNPMALAGAGASIVRAGTQPSNAFAAKPVAPTPTPAAPTMNPFAIAPPSQGSQWGNAFKSFATGLVGRDEINAIDDRYKAQDAEKSKQKMALLQQFRAMPVEQRMAALPQLSQAIGKEVPQEVMSDQAIDQQLAIMQGQLGIAPAVPEPYTLSSGAERRGPNNEVLASNPVERAPVEAKAPTVNSFGQMWDGEKWVTVPGALDNYGRMHPQEPRQPNASQDTYRPATAQDKQAWGIPLDAPVKINNRTGEPEVITGAKSASEYTPTQQNKFIQQAQVMDSMQGALDSYKNLIRSTNPQMWTTGLGGDNPDAKKLDAAQTALLIQAKELFNLGVLNGPDLDIISKAVPKVTGFDAAGKSADSAIAQMSILEDYITRGRNQIPPEFIEKARPNGGPQVPTSSGKPSFFTQKFQGAASQIAPQAAQPQQRQQPRTQAPANVPPAAVTDLMNDPSPDAMQEFNDVFGEGAAEAILNGAR